MPEGWQTFKTFAPGEATIELAPADRYDPDNQILTHDGERYRAISPDAETLHIYDLEGVEVEPDDYSLRIEAEKI